MRGVRTVAIASDAALIDASIACQMPRPKLDHLPMHDWIDLAPYIVAGSAAIATVVWWSYRSMDARITTAERDIAEHKLDLAKNCTSRKESESMTARVFERLDQIYAMLANKEDRK